MSTHTINGVSVRFPYAQPYVAQKALMSKVITALTKKKNALLESPTGSGKSLAILCSTLGWHIHTHKNKEQNKNENDNSDNNNNENVSKENEENNRNENKEKSLESGNNEDSNKAVVMIPPLPTRPTLTQEKTMAGLADDMEMFAFGNELMGEEKKEEIPKIYFTTRTHHQITQLINEFRRTEYGNMVKMTVLGSRKHLCVNEAVAASSDIQGNCRKALQSKDCKFRSSYKDSAEWSRMVEFEQGKIFDIEDLVQIGRTKGKCPYYGSRSLLETCEIVFCPYNYILDPVIRESMKIELSNSIVIIDEAHNVEQVCRESVSKSFTNQDFDNVLREIDNTINYQSSSMEAATLEGFQEIKTLIRDINDWFTDQQQLLGPNDFKNLRNAYPNPVCRENNRIQDLIKTQWGVDENSIKLHLGHAKLIFEHFRVLIDEKKEIDNENENDRNKDTDNSQNHSPNRSKNKQLMTAHSLAVINYLVSVALPRSYAFEDDYFITILPEEKWNSDKRMKEMVYFLHFWCMSPSVAFKELGDACHSVILTSGTLSPLNAFACELGVPFEIGLTASHVIDPSQVMISSFTQGINGNHISCKYVDLQNGKMVNDIGNTICDLFSIIKDGILIFFPSYSTMERLINKWKENGIWQKMQQFKKLYIEPRGSNEQATLEFYHSIENFGILCGNEKSIQLRAKRDVSFHKRLQKLRNINNGMDNAFKNMKNNDNSKNNNNNNKSSKKQKTIISYCFDKNDNSKKKEEKENGKIDYSFDSMMSNNDKSNEEEEEEDNDINFETRELLKGVNGALDGKCNGAAFFGVCRGKISEGIDFSDRMSRAVIILGIPYPNSKDLNVTLKQKYNDYRTNRESYDQSDQRRRHREKDCYKNEAKMTVNGSKWYTLQGFRALNQALGRCIRHRNDYGCVFLFDKRFAQKQNCSKALSKWTQKSFGYWPRYIDLKPKIISFFDRMNSNPPGKAIKTSNGNNRNNNNINSWNNGNNNNYNKNNGCCNNNNSTNNYCSQTYQSQLQQRGWQQSQTQIQSQMQTQMTNSTFGDSGGYLTNDNNNNFSQFSTQYGNAPQTQNGSPTEMTQMRNEQVSVMNVSNVSNGSNGSNENLDFLSDARFNNNGMYDKCNTQAPRSRTTDNQNERHFVHKKRSFSQFNEMDTSAIQKVEMFSFNQFNMSNDNNGNSNNTSPNDDRSNIVNRINFEQEPQSKRIKLDQFKYKGDQFDTESEKNNENNMQAQNENENEMNQINSNNNIDNNNDNDNTNDNNIDNNNDNETENENDDTDASEEMTMTPSITNRVEKILCKICSKHVYTGVLGQDSICGSQRKQPLTFYTLPFREFPVQSSEDVVWTNDLRMCFLPIKCCDELLAFQVVGAPPDKTKHYGEIWLFEGNFKREDA